MARGTSFEHLSLTLLNQNFGMELERVGGAGDKGIDLKGWWDLTSLLLAQAEPQASQRVSSGGGGGGAAAGGPKRLRVIAQCKCLDPSRKLGPSVVREIEGVLHRALTVPSGGLSNRSSSPSPSSPQSSPSSDDQHPVAGSERGQNVVGGEPGGGGMGLVGALLSSSGFSKQATLQARSSSFPLLLIHIQSLPEAYIMDHLEMVDKASNYQATSPPPPREKRTTPTSPSKSTKSNRLEEMVKDGDRFLSVIWNDALASTRGPLQGRMEFRFQRDLRSYRKGSVGGTAKDQVTDYKEEDGRVGRPVLYWDGKKLKL
ncbi:hypothetical protein IE53DRAFT_387699 [Violaceomyces palustris]|uniref:Uncharacterized protein n=1 Tax=Violaceomyces palustris TaxID=1673888 RepID=A0ACD0NW50_9BASI|nr:hypothetical protein IE53DRAFT_387699 [Violaceomyces palustris]